jgi:hypothetical protein
MGRFQFPTVTRRILPKREPFSLLVHLGSDCGAPPGFFVTCVPVNQRNIHSRRDLIRLRVLLLAKAQFGMSDVCFQVTPALSASCTLLENK